MKKFKYILLVAGALSFSACESWLDEDPQYTVNSKNQFSTAENAQRALLGCYGYMSADNAYGQAWQEVMMGYSGFGYPQTNGSSADFLLKRRISAPLGSSRQYSDLSLRSPVQRLL